MSKQNYHKTYRQFVVYPFKDNGVVTRLDGKAHEFIEKGHRVIKDVRGVKHPISHIIYSVGRSASNGGYCVSFRHMKNFTVRFKNGNKLDCSFVNLSCRPKKKYVTLLKHQDKLSKYWI